jgi:hypothetical protein
MLHTTTEHRFVSTRRRSFLAFPSQLGVPFRKRMNRYKAFILKENQRRMRISSGSSLPAQTRENSFSDF